MPGLDLALPRDPHTRKTAGGATAAPPGMQPILVQSECALVAAIGPVNSLKGAFRSDLTVPETPRRPVPVRTTALSSGTVTGALPGRSAASRSLGPAASRPPATASRPFPGERTPFLPGRVPSAARDRVRKRTIRLCRRKVIDEEGNARQRTPAGREPDCHRRERRARRTVYRAQQPRELRGEHL